MTHGPGTPNRPIGVEIDVETLKTIAKPIESSLYEQLKGLEAEKMPDYIKSEQGRVFWQQSQRKKIQELKSKLK